MVKTAIALLLMTLASPSFGVTGEEITEIVNLMRAEEFSLRYTRGPAVTARLRVLATSAQRALRGMSAQQVRHLVIPQLYERGYGGETPSFVFWSVFELVTRWIRAEAATISNAEMTEIMVRVRRTVGDHDFGQGLGPFRDERGIMLAPLFDTYLTERAERISVPALLDMVCGPRVYERRISCGGSEYLLVYLLRRHQHRFSPRQIQELTRPFFWARRVISEFREWSRRTWSQDSHDEILRSFCVRNVAGRAETGPRDYEGSRFSRQ